MPYQGQCPQCAQRTTTTFQLQVPRCAVCGAIQSGVGFHASLTDVPADIKFYRCPTCAQERMHVCLQGTWYCNRCSMHNDPPTLMTPARTFQCPWCRTERAVVRFGGRDVCAACTTPVGEHLVNERPAPGFADAFRCIACGRTDRPLDPQLGGCTTCFPPLKDAVPHEVVHVRADVTVGSHEFPRVALECHYDPQREEWRCKYHAGTLWLSPVAFGRVWHALANDTVHTHTVLPRVFDHAHVPVQLRHITVGASTFADTY